MDMGGLAKWIILAGLGIAAFGVLLLVLTRLGLPLGRLPGDLRYEGERTAVHFPLMTMIIVSIILTIVINVLLRLFR